MRNGLAVALIGTAAAHWAAFQPQQAGVLALDAVLVLAAAPVWKRRASGVGQPIGERAAPYGTALTSWSRITLPRLLL